MTEKDRAEFFHKIRLKLDEIEDIMEEMGGRENFISLWCFGTFIPSEDEVNERYDVMTGMHMAVEEEFDLMASMVAKCFNEYIDNPDDDTDTGRIDYWLNK